MDQRGNRVNQKLKIQGLRFLSLGGHGVHHTPTSVLLWSSRHQNRWLPRLRLAASHCRSHSNAWYSWFFSNQVISKGGFMRRVKQTSSYAAVVACLFLVVTWPGRAGGQTGTTGVTVFEGARLITGDGGAPIENSAFIVEHNLFTRVGSRGELRVPAGAVRVDLKGKTVMPAMV